MQDMNNSMTMMFWQQCSETQEHIYIYMQNFQVDWYGTGTGMENFAS
jgi:hypothetical protein